MSDTLFSELDDKVSQLLDELESLRTEVKRLKEEKGELEAQQSLWHQRLENLLQKMPAEQQRNLRTSPMRLRRTERLKRETMITGMLVAF